jgi:hypothetical protein
VSNTQGVECASAGTDARQALIAYRSLSEKTGVPVAEVARLMLGGKSRVLFGADGMLRSREELRSLARPGTDGRQALDEMMRKRPGEDARTELARLRAKRRLWTNP